MRFLSLLILPALFLVGCGREEPAGVACAAPTAEARWQAPARHLFLVQEAGQVEAALDSAATMSAGGPGASAEIIVCGDAVRHLVQGGALEPALEAAAGKGVRVVACRRSLQSNAVEPESLSPHVGAVDDGLAEGVRLEREGWISVEL